jgi:hypothetical protein
MGATQKFCNLVPNSCALVLFCVSRSYLLNKVFKVKYQSLKESEGTPHFIELVGGKFQR